MANDCLRRAFEAGLRWCNVQNNVPQMTCENEAKNFANQFGLSFTSLDRETYRLSNDPIILIYRDNYEATDSEYHAVFLSDSALLTYTRHLNYAVISGFETLMS